MPSWAHLGIGETGMLAQRQSGDDVALQPMADKVANHGEDHGKKGIRGSNTFVATAALRLPAPNVVGIADTPVLLSPCRLKYPTFASLRPLLRQLRCLALRSNELLSGCPDKTADGNQIHSVLGISILQSK